MAKLPKWKEVLFMRTAYYSAAEREYRELTGRDRSKEQDTELYRRESMTHAMLTAVCDMGLRDEYWKWYRTAPKNSYDLV